MKVLIGVDGSESCLRAVNYVLEHAEVFGVTPQITLITVHLPVPSPRARSWLGHDVLQQYYDDESNEALAGARAAIKAKGRTAKELMLVGDPASEIARAAKDAGARMIVLGTHGRSALSTLVMGSVANKVLAQASVPVLLVK